MKKLYISAITFCAIYGNSFAQNQSKPNILWLTYEDTSPEFIGCYGNHQAKTPNIDSLAKDGVLFSSAFSSGAVSSASRFCLITGIPANRMGTGNHRSGYRIPQEIKGFPYFLRQAGYYTSNNSKTDYNIANAKELTREAWNESSGKAGWWNRKPGQPFFAVYNSIASHQSRTMTNTWTKYEEQVLNQLTPNEQIHEGGLVMPSFFRESPEMQRHMSRVYNSIALMDKEFGSWLDRLEKEGLKDSTIVFCFSDHGEGISRSKGSATTTGFRVPFVVWIPPMYKHLSPWGDGIITDELVCFEDLAPTMLHLAGADIPSYMKGRIFMGQKVNQPKKYVFSGVDRTDESSELSRSVTDGRYLYTRVFMPFQPFVRWNMYYDMSDMQQTIRRDFNQGLLNELQRAILEPRQAEYLFDTENDKWGTVNLIDKPQFNKKVKELRKALQQNIVSNRDPHFMTEYAFLNSNLSPVELAKHPKDYPIVEVLDVALWSGLNGDKIIKAQLGALSNANPYVRYWASVGLFSQKGKLVKHQELLTSLMEKESFPPAKITLAALLFKIDGQNNLDKARYILDINNPELLRMGLNLLITVDEAQQKLILTDLKNLLLTNQSRKEKGLFACNEYLTLFIHKLENTPLVGDDSF